MRLRDDFEYLRALSAGEGPRPEEYADLDGCFHRLGRALRSGALSPAALHDMWRTLGDAFCTTLTIQGLGIVKPYGYAGDFELIDRIYTGWLSPDPRLAPWDVFLQQHKAPQAVRNRKRYFLNLLNRYLATSDRPVVRVLSVGSGPSRECLEFFDAGHASASRVVFELVDQDPRALAYARTLNAAHAAQIVFHCAKAQHFTSAEKFDFIWSAGLFDYLPDRAFTALAGRLFRLLQPHGLLTIGNFDPSNPTRDYMEFAEWRLRYRTREDLYRLAFGNGVIPNVNHLCVDAEPEEVNLFLHIARPAV